MSAARLHRSGYSICAMSERRRAGSEHSSSRTQKASLPVAADGNQGPDFVTRYALPHFGRALARSQVTVAPQYAKALAIHLPPPPACRRGPTVRCRMDVVATRSQLAAALA